MSAAWSLAHLAPPTPAAGCQCLLRGLSKCYCKTPTAAADSVEGLPSFLKKADENVPEALKKARAEGAASRDIRKAGIGLVDMWREVSKPSKKGAIPRKPPGCVADFSELFQQWLDHRELSHLMQRVDDQQGWAVFQYLREPVIDDKPDWETAFHGTWWYAVWSVLKSGVLLASNDKSLGHDFWEPGVYCSPSVDTGLWYARPQIMFGDGVYHRIMFELRVDGNHRKKNRKRGGIQWVFPDFAVALKAVWVRTNAPPSNGMERVDSWQPELEALPPGYSQVPSVVNPRNLAHDAWPPMVDEFPFTDPWATDAPVGPNSTPYIAPAAAQVTDGLYGHWWKGSCRREQQMATQNSLDPMDGGPLAKEMRIS